MKEWETTTNFEDCAFCGITDNDLTWRKHLTSSGLIEGWACKSCMKSMPAKPKDSFVTAKEIERPLDTIYETIVEIKGLGTLKRVKPGRKIDESRNAKIIKMREDGYSCGLIAEKFGLSTQYIWQICKRGY